MSLNRNSFNEGRRSLDRFLHAILWTILSADEGHFLSAIGGQNPSAQALVNNWTGKPYCTGISRVNVFYFKLSSNQICCKVSSKTSGIFKSKYYFLVRANLPHILYECMKFRRSILKTDLTQFIHPAVNHHCTMLIFVHINTNKAGISFLINFYPLLLNVSTIPTGNLNLRALVQEL